MTSNHSAWHLLPEGEDVSPRRVRHLPVGGRLPTTSSQLHLVVTGLSPLQLAQCHLSSLQLEWTVHSAVRQADPGLVSASKTRHSGPFPGRLPTRWSFPAHQVPLQWACSVVPNAARWSRLFRNSALQPVPWTQSPSCLLPHISASPSWILTRKTQSWLSRWSAASRQQQCRRQIQSLSPDLQTLQLSALGGSHFHPQRSRSLGVTQT